MSMLHHISFGVSNIERAASFYDAALAPLGYVRVWEDIEPGATDQAVGYGIPGGGDKFAIKLRPKGQRPPGPGFHLAFGPQAGARSRIFMRRHLKRGGRDNGGPGFRPAYGSHYYAAFVIDPDAHPIEAVFNSPE